MYLIKLKIKNLEVIVDFDMNEAKNHIFIFFIIL